MSDKRVLGPNMKRLLAFCLAKEAIPAGGGMKDALDFFSKTDHRRAVIEKAMQTCDACINAAKRAHDNPYGDDEEAIAAAILGRLE